MISPNPFYNSLFKKYVAIFGSLFNNLRIDHLDVAGNVIQTVQVPISYGPREKFLARLTENPTGSAITSITLPRMAFEISSVQYNPSRKLQTLNKTVSKQTINGANVYKKVFSPVPYDIGMKLEIMTKTMEDGLKIVEQILPYFTPEWNVTVQLLAGDFPEYTDIPIVLDGVQMDDQYEGDFNNRKVLTFILNFTMKCYFYGPITESKLIKIVEVNLYPDTTANTTIVETSIRPGLTAQGLPTSNADLSVALSMIEETDRYGFIITSVDKYGGA